MKKHKYGFEYELTGEIQTTGFYVDFYGDRSVGISDQKFTIKPEENCFVFDQDRDVEDFKELLMDAFEVVTGERCVVETFEERHRRLEEMDAQITDVRKVLGN